jgi:hypothetical protein
VNALQRAEQAARPSPRKWIKGPVCAQDYADVVIRCLETATEHVLHAGDTLIKAKGKLPHGEWGRMFKDHPQAVARPIPFGARTGQMLMQVAEHPILSDANHGSLLPRSWRTLYELSRLPEPVLVKAIADGKIHPGLERNAVAALTHQYQSHEAAVVSTDAHSPAAQDFEQLRDAVLVVVIGPSPARPAPGRASRGAATASRSAPDPPPRRSAGSTADGRAGARRPRSARALPSRRA